MLLGPGVATKLVIEVEAVLSNSSSLFLPRGDGVVHQRSRGEAETQNTKNQGGECGPFGEDESQTSGRQGRAMVHQLSSDTAPEAILS